MKRNNSSSTFNTAFNRFAQNAGWLVETDLRTFPELIGHWMDAEGCSASIPDFLSKTGLEQFIAADDFRDVYLGKKMPGPRFASVLSMALPGQYMRPDENALFGVGLYRLRRSATYWRNTHAELPVVEMDTLNFARFSREQIAKIHTQEANAPLAYEHIDDSAGDVLDEAFVKLAKSANKTLEEFFEVLSEHYAVSPLTTLQVISSLLHEEGVAAADREIVHYLEAQQNAQSQRHSKVGDTLKFLRLSRNYTYMDLANLLQVNVRAISAWQSGEKPIPDVQLKPLVEAMALNVDEALALLSFARPALVARIGPQWLAGKVMQKSWDFILHPALDKTWLAQQDPKKQAGLLLSAFRGRAGRSQREVAKAIEVDDTVCSRWESGDYAIHRTKVGALLAYLKPTEEEASRFALLVNPELAAGHDSAAVQEALTQQSWEHASYPALNVDWLGRQDLGKRAGLFLRDARLRANKSQSDIAKALNVTYYSVMGWEQGANVVPATKLGALIATMELTPDEALRFVMLVRNDMLVDDKTDWLQLRLARKEFTSIHYPALDAEWLAYQELPLRSGLMLRDFRLRAAKSQSDIAKLTGTSQHIIFNWEHGKRIDPEQLAVLGEYLGLSQEEGALFNRTVTDSNMAIKAQLRAPKVLQTQKTVTAPTVQISEVARITHPGVEPRHARPLPAYRKIKHRLWNFQRDMQDVTIKNEYLAWIGENMQELGHNLRDLSLVIDCSLSDTKDITQGYVVTAEDDEALYKAFRPKNLDTLGSLLRKYRNEHRWTNATFAREVKIPLKAMGALLRDERDASNIEAQKLIATLSMSDKDANRLLREFSISNVATSQR